MRYTSYFLALLSLIILSSCEKDYIDVVKGSGPVIAETRKTASFNMINLSIPADVFVTQGNSERIVIEAQENVMDVINTDVRGGEVNIRFANGVVVKRFEPIKIFITTRNIKELRVSGSGNIYNNSPIFTDELYITVSGSGNVDLQDIDSPIVESNISGSGQIYLSGFCADQYAQISGSGSIHAFGLLSESTNIDISGSGKTEVSVSNYLSVRISGSGNVYYKGRPSLVTRISGSGGVYSVH